MTPGQTSQVQITYQNAGNNDWLADGNFMIYSQNSPLTVWGVVNSGVTVATTNGNNYTFTLNIKAPAVAGSYDHKWSMRKHNNPESGFFGEAIDIPVSVVVSSCGNGVVEEDQGETCDDGGTTPGDGCDGSCLIEAQQVDLLSETIQRSFTGINLHNVATGDFSQDGTTDIIVSEGQGVDSDGVAIRSQAGTVTGYLGGASFFSGATTATPTGSSFQLIGGALDELGAFSDGRIFVERVSGVGGTDLIVSAAKADGESDGRQDAGEILVIPASSLTGYIDVATEPAPAAVRARIVGPVANGRARVIAVADVDADTYADILIGVPYAAPSGRSDAGEAYLIKGGPDAYWGDRSVYGELANTDRQV